MQSVEVDVSTRAASQPGLDAKLVLEALRTIQTDVSSMKQTMASVERTGLNNAQQLEALDTLLRARVTAAPPTTPANPPEKSLVPTRALAIAIISVLLLSRRLRRLFLRGLHMLPLSLVAITQLTCSSALLTYRGYDVLDRVLGSGLEGGSEARERIARRRALAYSLLLASVAVVPAKGLARALLPAPDARRRQMVHA